MSIETKQAIEHEYHLDESLPRQYYSWISGIFHGDLGKSFQYRESVTSLLAPRLSTTVQLVIMAAILIIIFSIPLGIISASHKNSWLDQILTVISLIMVSSPSFFTGILLMLLFTMVFPIFPTFGIGSNVIENIRYLFLPACALAAVRMALTLRITRSNMVEQLSNNYVETARAKGLSWHKVVYKHALKNASIPILTVTSLQIAEMMGGSVFVEKVFALNGVGSLLADSVSRSDYPVVQTITLFMVIIFLLVNLIVDILYAVIDPRIRI